MPLHRWAGEGTPFPCTPSQKQNLAVYTKVLTHPSSILTEAYPPGEIHIFELVTTWYQVSPFLPSRARGNRAGSLCLQRFGHYILNPTVASSNFYSLNWNYASHPSHQVSALPDLQSQTQDAKLQVPD